MTIFGNAKYQLKWVISWITRGTNVSWGIQS